MGHGNVNLVPPQCCRKPQCRSVHRCEIVHRWRKQKCARLRDGQLKNRGSNPDGAKQFLCNVQTVSGVNPLSYILSLHPCQKDEQENRGNHPETIFSSLHNKVSHFSHDFPLPPTFLLYFLSLFLTMGIGGCFPWG